MISLQRLRKLRRMSLDEIRVRVGGRLRKRRDRAVWRNGRNGGDGAGRDAGKARRLLEAACALVPGCQVEELASLRARQPHMFQQLAAQAEAIARGVLSGTWAMLG